MKYIFPLLFLCFSVTYSQIGINTTTVEDGVALKIESSDEGILIPRVSLTAKNNLSPFTTAPPTSTLIYNTQTSGTFPNNVVPGFYYWDGSVWRPINDTKISKTTKFSNNSTSTNFNTSGGVDIDIFNSLQWNEDTALYNKINNTQLEILETGLYRVTCNLSLVTSDIERYIYTSLRLDTTDVGDRIHGVGPEDSGGNDKFSIHFSQIIQINAGQILKLRSYRDGSSATITFDSLGTSSILVERVR
ncbi:hypothetical protein C8N46_104268 [Kordia periserrulae]|uniref:TNF family profile domain-containing protein n=1 Tax=Kordia periserrulae TaxID=701523 RepID=A0A2T6BZY8_9FLAO|nr:hypothetical protein [Kordia periserrulae]PTX61625.1 hypothetical protein C8N46_104268 [Kordia periserrulae]